MSRPAFSVRFPAPLADALDRWATARQSSRSDLVEAIITATTPEDRDEILRVPVTDAPTEKLNLRLSPAALGHLVRLAGDHQPADFLRRTVTAAVGSVGQSAASPPRTGRRAGVTAREHVAAPHEVDAPLIGFAALVVIAILGIMIWLLVQALTQVSEPPPPPPGPDTRGQLDTGALDGGDA